jgi:MFS family permease
MISLLAGIFDPYFYVIQYSQFRGVPANLAFYMLSSMSAGGVGGRIALPFFADTIGRFNILALVAFLSGFSCLAIGLQAKSLPTLLVFSVLYGLFSGAYITVVAPCVAQISKLDQVGSRVGMMYSLLSIP